MRLISSDPVGAGINTFSQVVDTFDKLENSSMRRELMAQNIADKRIDKERQAKNDAFEEEKRTEWRKAVGEQAVQKLGQKSLNDIASVIESQETAKKQGREWSVNDLSENQVNSILRMADFKKFIDKDGKVNPNKIGAIKTLLSIQDPQLQQAIAKKGKVTIDLNKNKPLSDAFHSIYGDEVNEGVGKDGLPTKKRVSAINLDFSQGMPNLTFDLNVSVPKSGAGNLIPLKGYEKDVYNIPEDPKPTGQVERGNIDLSQRKVAINPDGSISTVLSRSFNIDGKEVLLPLVSDSGNIVSDKEAIDNFKKTGKHLGMFESPEAATQYAEKLHNSQIWKPSIDYYSQDSYPSVMTWGRDGSPDAQVKQIPLPVIGMQLTSMSKLGDWLNQLEAKHGSTEFSKRIQTLRKSRESDAAAVKAYENSGGDSKKFVKSMMDQGMAIDEIKKYSEVLGKTTPKMESQTGKQMADREKLVKEFGETSDEVKKFDENSSSGKGKPKEGEIRKYDDAGTTITEEFKDGKWVKKAKSPKFKPDGGEKETPANLDKRLKAIAESSESPAVMKTAQDKIRKNQKLDSYKAIEDSKTEIITTIQKAGKSSIAVEALKKMGVSEEDAKDEVKRYIKKMNKKAK